MAKLEVVFFAVCTLFVLLGAVFTVAARNPIRGAMGLLTTILGVAGMYLLLAAELLAAVQVVVYAGAVVILFLFVIMLIGPSSTGTSDARGAFGRYAGALVFLLFSAFSLWVITRMGGGSELTRMTPPPAGMGTVELIGREIFTQKVVVFELAGVLLLVAVVGAMAVASGKGAALFMPVVEREIAKKSAAKAVAKAKSEAVIGLGHGAIHAEKSVEPEGSGASS
jgi:NADH-quinone oxidoreductase subunit J